jgi:hypothetical protein
MWNFTRISNLQIILSDKKCTQKSFSPKTGVRKKYRLWALSKSILCQRLIAIFEIREKFRIFYAHYFLKMFSLFSTPKLISTLDGHKHKGKSFSTLVLEFYSQSKFSCADIEHIFFLNRLPLLYSTVRWEKGNCVSFNKRQTLSNCGSYSKRQALGNCGSYS